jgi:preprotein translocase subunit SecG
MNLLMNLVVALQILSALVMIGLVLIQHGKGADMGASFGSGSSGSLFGATGSANFLSRSTAVCAGVFFICTLALAYTSNERQPSGGGSVLDRPAVNAPVIPATGADQVPGAASGVAIVPAAAAPAPAPAAAPAASGAAAIPAK